MASERENKKKAEEVADCHRVADAINRRDGTDYAAKPHEGEPGDAALESASGKNPLRLIQVVTVPVSTDEEPNQFALRSDNKNIEKFFERLQNELTKLGMTGAHVAPLVQPLAAERGVPEEQVKVLARAIVRAGKTKPDGWPQDVGYTELCQEGGEVLGYASLATIWWDAGFAGVDVQAPGLAAALPADGRWIWEGVETKLGKYGKDAADLILVIGTRQFIDREQTAAFVREHHPEKLPFAEVWIDSIEGAICLKGR